VSFFDGYIYEGTGLYGSSQIRKLDPKDPSEPIEKYTLPSEFFGEGITHYINGNDKDRFIQLTWREGQALVYDAKTLNSLFSFEYHIETSNGEGWGITFDSLANEFIVSDGSVNLFFWDAAELDACEIETDSNTQNEIENEQVDDENAMRECDLEIEASRSIMVRSFLRESPEPIPVRYLNELELVPGMIDGTLAHTVLANVWFQRYLLEIDPKSGIVLRLFDLATLCPELSQRGENVLNGISISGDGDRVIFVTGKQWDSMYKIRLHY
jgi:glutamine cyclotransferase